jgi:hypothetical protein
MLRSGYESHRASDGSSLSISWYLGFVSLCFVLLLIALVSIKTASGGRFSQMAVYLIFFASVPIIAALPVYYRTFRANPYFSGVTANRWLEYVGDYLPAAVLIYGLWGIDRVLYHADYQTIDPTGFTSSSRRFFYGCLVASLLIVSMAALRMREGLRISRVISESTSEQLRSAFLAIFIISLFKVDIGHDSLSYDPYIGPASAAALGALPMVEVFSQYGLNYVLLTAWLKLTPWSMYSMSLAVTILDLAYYLVVALICIRMSTDKTLATVLSAFLILFLLASALYNPAYTPSAGAMRYLPSMLLLLALCHLREKSAFSGASILACGLSSLWSLEAMIFSAITYSTYIFVTSLYPRPIDFRRIATRLSYLGGLLLVPHVVLTAGYALVLGVFPRYDIYLQLVLTQTTSTDWIIPADPAIRTWVIFGFAYALALAYALFRSWEPSRYPERHHNRYAVIAATSALGIMQFSYYAGRGVSPVLVLLAFPLLILFVLFVDDCIQSFDGRGERPESHHRLRLALVICMFVACGGVIGDRFFREPYVLRSNATLLRECLSWHPGQAHCWRGLTRRVRGKLSQPAGFVLPKGIGVTDKEPATWQLIPTGTTWENIAAYLLIKKWLSAQERVFLFIPDAATVLFSLKKQNALGLTHAMVDDRSSILRARAMDAAQNISDGTIIMVGDMSQQPIEREIHAYLKQRWRLEQIDTMHGVAVLRVHSKS